MVAAQAGEAEEAEAELYRRFAFRIRLLRASPPSGRAPGARPRAAGDAGDDREATQASAVRDWIMIGLVHPRARAGRMAIDLKRKECRRETLREAFLTIVRWPPSPGQRALRSSIASSRAWPLLAERERTVVSPDLLRDRTRGEIAQTLGISEGNVRVIRHRAIERLRGCMGRRKRVVMTSRCEAADRRRERSSTTGRATCRSRNQRRSRSTFSAVRPGRPDSNRSRRLAPGWPRRWRGRGGFSGSSRARCSTAAARRRPRAPLLAGAW